MHSLSSNALLQDLTSLTERFGSLATRLSQTAQALRDTGVPPSDDIVEEMKASSTAFTELRTRGVSLAESLALSSSRQIDTLTSLSEVKALLQLIAQTEEQMKTARERSRRALELVDRLYALKHRDREVFAPLSECQMRATVLRNAIAETPLPQIHPEVEGLLADDHPFRALLTMVEQGEQLEDERCASLQDIIEAAFGKPLAVAALRGKLTLLPDVTVDKQEAPVEVPVSTPFATQHRVKEESQGELRTASSVTRLMPEATEEKKVPSTVAFANGTKPETREATPPIKPVRAASAPVAEQQPDLPPRFVFEASLEKSSDPPLRFASEPSLEKQAEVTTDSRHGTWEPSPALRLVNGVHDTPETDEETSSLLQNGDRRETPIFEKQSAALRKSANQPVSASPPSGSLASLRPVFIPDPVQDESETTDTSTPVFPSGPAATKSVTNSRGAGIVDVFYRFEPEDKAQKIANLILTGAYGLVEEKPAFLRDLVWRLVYEEKLSLAFHIARCLEVQHPDFHPRLPSWLLRAVTLGQRLRTPHGEIARILKEDFARCDAECRATGDKEWDLAIELLLIGAALFPAFLAPETRASTILHGVCLDESLEQLSAYCNVIALHGDLSVPLDPMSLKKPSRGQARESVGFVRRLIGNQEADNRRDIVSDQAEPLRIEVINRQHAVLDEINLCRQVNRSVPLLGGLACCRRAIEHVATFFDPETPFSADEPLPRPLLNAELSRIPNLILNKQGDVEGVEKPAFIDHLLRLVASGSLKML
ncbi:MAG: hypothetical protein AB7G75_16270 [Candidatus Binatia bacterium]